MVDRAAYFAQGTSLEIGDGGSPETFTPIPGVQGITGPGRTRDTVDVTSHSSTGGFREYIGGLRDGGSITADMNELFVDEAQELLKDAYDQDDPVTFRLVYPYTDLNETDTFLGYVVDLSGSFPTDAQAARSLEIKITGPVTRTNDES